MAYELRFSDVCRAFVRPPAIFTASHRLCEEYGRAEEEFSHLRGLRLNIVYCTQPPATRCNPVLVP